MSNFENLRDSYRSVLPESFDSKNLTQIQEKFISNKLSEHDQKAVVDQAFRDILMEMLERESDVKLLQDFVTFCIESCRLDMTSSTMPVVLLGDIFDALTLDKCEEMFSFVERGVQTWKEPLFFSSCKNNLLRMCNDLLRRLSRSQNTVFCGRILLFLAKFFPFSERSGLNIVSEFNLENLTEFGVDNGSSDFSNEMDTSEDEKTVKIDYNLYCKFWALQDFFRDPTQCYEKVQWKKFTHHANHVLLAFSSFKLDDVRSKRMKLDEPETETHYFAKYLTNQKLLELQLSDSNFRRYVLVQFLILFQYLNSAVKFKSEKFELKQDQIEWVNTMTDMVYGLLSETPPDGRTFAGSIRHILSREEHWNIWKNEGCPEFKKPVSSTEISEDIEKKRFKRKEKPLLGNLIKDAAESNKFIMGNAELTRLWNLCPNNLEACKTTDRDFLPSLETYFAEAIEQMDPTAMIEAKYKRINDPNFGWRSLRLLARRSPYFFTHSNKQITKLSEYLELMIKKIAKDWSDRNQEVVESENQNEPEIEDEFLKDTECDDENETVQKSEGLLSQEKLDMVSVKIGESWKTLAAKLGFHDDEIQYLYDEIGTDPLRCRNMLLLWFEVPEASLQNLIVRLEELEMNDALECIK